MYKKLFIGFSILLIGIFTFTFCYAADNTMLQDAAEGVRNAVGGAENAIEDGARDISNTSRDMTGGMENTAQNMTDDTRNSAQNMTNNDRYTATRTSAETGTTFMGMNATAWTWLIIGIAAIAIVALVWYYGTQLRSYDNNNHDE